MKKKKKLVVRIALFLVAIALAVYAFTYGITALTHRDSGYQDIDYSIQAKAVLYKSGLHLMYYADGTSSEIRSLVNAVQAVYSEAALKAYKLLDAKETYEGVVNIASINAAPNSYVTLSPELFDLLSDAVLRNSPGVYSVFAGPIHSQWQTLRYLDDPAECDPLTVTAAAPALLPESDDDPQPPQQENLSEILSGLAAWLGTPGTFGLTFDRETCRVRLDVDSAYLAWASENGIDYAVLDLNVLHDAYMVEFVARQLKAAGYTNGYLYTDSGLSVYLDPSGAGVTFSLLAESGGSPVSAAEVALRSPVSFCRFSAFAPTGEQYGYYSIQQEGRRVYRHLYPNIADGDYANVLMSCSLAAGEGKLVDLVCDMALLNSLGDGEAVRRSVLELPSDIFAAYTLQSDSASRLYVRANAQAATVKAVEGSAFETVYIK